MHKKLSCHKTKRGFRLVFYSLCLAFLTSCMGNPVGTYTRERTTEVQETKNENTNSDVAIEIAKDYTAVPNVSTNSYIRDKSNITIDVQENNSLESDIASETSDSKASKVSPLIAGAIFLVALVIAFIGYTVFTKFTALGKTFDTVSSRVGQELEDLMTESNDPAEQMKYKKIKDLLKK